MNTYQIWQQQIAQGLLLDKILPNVSFNGFNLSDCAELIPLLWNELDLADVSLETYLAPRSDGGGVTAHNITTRTIAFNMLIIWETKEDFQQKIDIVKEALTTTEWELILFMSWEFRRCKASIQLFEQTGRFETDSKRWEFAIEFVATEDFTAYFPTTQSDSITWNFTLNMDNLGTKRVYPNIYMIFDTANITEIRAIHNWYTYRITENITDGGVIAMTGSDDNIDNQQVTFLNW